MTNITRNTFHFELAKIISCAANRSDKPSSARPNFRQCKEVAKIILRTKAIEHLQKDLAHRPLSKAEADTIIQSDHHARSQRKADAKAEREVNPYSRALYDIELVHQRTDEVQTRKLYSRLEGLGQEGRVASDLLRVLKTTARGKLYKGCHASANRQRALQKLCDTLEQDAGALSWGWRGDEVHQNQFVLYVDLPTGQVHFRTSWRREGTDYIGERDGTDASRERIINWAATILATEEATNN